MSTVRFIHISIPEQRLCLRKDNDILFDVPASTAANGPGEVRDSGCTPRGWHVIRAKVGALCSVGTVFVGRRPTGEIFSHALRSRYPHRDWILTRILWISGLEPGKNRLGAVDTLRRYIYIHGCPDDVAVGRPGSHGCIRLRNSDVIALFEQVDVGTRVYIEG
jgi:Uncharacterized protein conserved in bacteria